MIPHIYSRPFDAPTLNRELLLEVLGKIEANPELHDQTAWRVVTDCGTKMCFAGWTCELTGATWSPRMAAIVADVRIDDPAEVYTTYDNFGRQVSYVPIGERARSQLGLTPQEAGSLFYECNTLDEVRAYVHELLEAS